MRHLISIALLISLLACQPQPKAPSDNDIDIEQSSSSTSVVEAIGLDGRELIQRAADSVTLANYAPLIEALENKVELTENEWVDLGNHYAALNRYNDAIEVYSQGLESFPKSYKLLRFKAHRQLSVRKIDPAISDLQKALELMGAEGGSEMEYYPNGEEKGTYRYWVWYHIGLGYYFRGDFDQAAEAFNQCLATATTDNNQAGAVEWSYNSLQLSGDKESAEEVLASFDPDPNADYTYARRLMMHKGLLSPDDMVDLAKNGTEWSGGEMTTAYGVANWYLFSGDTATATGIYRNVLVNPIWNYWAYIAAEAALTKE